MAVETLKDYLVGIGFEVDEGDAAKANAALEQLDGIVQGLGKVLENTAVAIRNLLSEFTGAGKIDDSANAMDAAADAAQEMASSGNAAADATGEMANAANRAADAADNLGDKTKQAASASDKAEKSLKKANKAAKLENAKKGADNVGKLDEKLKQVSSTVKTFVLAAATALIGSSIGTLVTDTIALTEALADNAKSMKKSIEETRAYNTALAVMGKTADEIKESKSLQSTFNDLQAIGAQMALPETAQGLRGISDLKDGLTQLRFVGNYALQWLMYKIQTVAEGPLAQVRDMVTSIKDWFAGNIEKVAEGIAKAFGNVVQLFMSLITAIQGVVSWIGELPPAIKIAGAVVLAIVAAMQSKFARVSLAISLILLLIDDFVTYMQGGDSLFGGFWGKLLEWVEKIKPVVDAFITNFSTGLQAVWDALKWLVDLIGGDAVVAIGVFTAALWALSSNPVILIIAAVIGLITALGSLINNWDAVKAKAEEVWTAIVDWVSGAWTSITEVWAGVKEWFAGIFTGIGDAISTAVGDMTGWATGAWETITTTLSGAYETVSGWFTGIGDAVTTAVGNVSQWATDAWNTITTKLSGAYESVTGWFSGIGEGISGAVGDLTSWASNAWTSITGWFSGAAETITGWFSGITLPTAEDISGFASTAWSTISGFLSGAAEKISGWFDGIDISDKVAGVSSWASDAWATITGAFSNVSTWFTDNVWTPITNVFNLDSIVSFFKGVATNIWDGLTGGLSEKVGSVTETVKGFFSNVWDGVLSFFGIASSSTLAKEAGENVMDGFGNGTEGKQASITEKVKGVFSTIWEGAKSVWDGVTGWLGKLFGWSDSDESAKNTAQTEVSTAAGEVASAVTDSFTDVETAISEPIVNGTTTATTAFTDLQTTITTVMLAIQTVIENAATLINTNLTSVSTDITTMSTEAVTTASGITTSFGSIVSDAKKLATDVNNALKGLPTTIQTIFTSLANNMINTFTNAASQVLTQVSNIKTALASIPRTISVTVSAKQAFSFGGVVDRETDAKIGEDGREYVIPVTKPSRAIALMRSAAAELGLNVQTSQEAAAALGGKADKNVTPVYAAAGGNTSNTVNSSINVSTPATINVYGNNAQSIANNVARTQERLVLRNIKTALA